MIDSIIAATAGIGGLVWGMYAYAREQEKNRAAQLVQSNREAEIAEKEYMRPWLESQRDIYCQALSAAATASVSDDAETLKRTTEEFFALYQGTMILVETMAVSGAMVDFGHCLDGTSECSKDEMKIRCRALATKMASSMADTAKMSYREFAANKFSYAPGKA